jgi:hypothetical protein
MTIICLYLQRKVRRLTGELTVHKAVMQIAETRLKRLSESVQPVSTPVTPTDKTVSESADNMISVMNRLCVDAINAIGKLHEATERRWQEQHLAVVDRFANVFEQAINGINRAMPENAIQTVVDGMRKQSKATMTGVKEAVQAALGDEEDETE